ncbi:MAG: hypothetical protein WCW87_03430 [Candidatus Paceibacterota bacterium]
MTKNLAIFILAILIVLVPFSGFPSGWKTIFYIIAGLAIAVLSFLSSRRMSKECRSIGEVKNRVYAENDQAQNEPKNF